MRRVAYALTASVALMFGAATQASAGCYGGDCNGYQGDGYYGGERTYYEGSRYYDSGSRGTTVYYERGPEIQTGYYERPLYRGGYSTDYNGDGYADGYAPTYRSYSGGNGYYRGNGYGGGYGYRGYGYGGGYGGGYGAAMDMVAGTAVATATAAMVDMAAGTAGATATAAMDIVAGTAVAMATAATDMAAGTAMAIGHITRQPSTPAAPCCRPRAPWAMAAMAAARPTSRTAGTGTARQAADDENAPRMSCGARGLLRPCDLRAACPWQAALFYASTLAVRALSWMKMRRGSTSSPISLAKMSLASSISLTLT